MTGKVGRKIICTLSIVKYKLDCKHILLVCTKTTFPEHSERIKLKIFETLVVNYLGNLYTSGTDAYLDVSLFSFEDTSFGMYN